ncbi:MAG: pilus assembly protein CpaE [Nocardioides sp.]
MITTHEAERLDYLLRSQGRPWVPAPGDRFSIPGRDLDGVFVLAEMTIEVENLPSGPLVKFNGTTEWALDSIPAADVLWLPWEHQLRSLLGGAFAALERTPQGYVVRTADGAAHPGESAEAAYVGAVLGMADPAHQQF